MQSLSESVALALPCAAERYDLEQSIKLARKGNFPAQIRVGVGTMPPDIPLRVIGYAGLFARALERDIPKLVNRQLPITLFSSVAKVASQSGDQQQAKTILENGIRGLVALGSGLRLFGVENPIELELARPERELANIEFDQLEVDTGLATWFAKAAFGNSSQYPWQHYAVEHAAPSMFSDLRAVDQRRMLSIFVGGRTEAPFWAIRRLVRLEGLRGGCHQVNDSCGLILRRAKRPWYLPTDSEPRMGDLMLRGNNKLAQRVKRAYDPQRGGNCGLKAELQVALAKLSDPQTRSIADLTLEFETSIQLAHQAQLDLGSHLSMRIRELCDQGIVARD